MLLELSLNGDSNASRYDNVITGSWTKLIDKPTIQPTTTCFIWQQTHGLWILAFILSTFWLTAVLGFVLHDWYHGHSKLLWFINLIYITRFMVRLWVSHLCPQFLLIPDSSKYYRGRSSFFPCELLSVYRVPKHLSISHARSIAHRELCLPTAKHAVSKYPRFLLCHVCDVSVAIAMTSQTKRVRMWQYKWRQKPMRFQGVSNNVEQEFWTSLPAVDVLWIFERSREGILVCIYVMTAYEEPMKLLGIHLAMTSQTKDEH